MPKITIENGATAEVEAGKRLVLALTEDLGTDQLHACGGKARCTTCRVEILEGNPESMRPAEEAALASRQLTGVRLSCQIACEHDMTVRVISRFEGSGRKDAGSPVSPVMEPWGGVGWPSRPSGHPRRRPRRPSYGYETKNGSSDFSDKPFSS